MRIPKNRLEATAEVRTLILQMHMWPMSYHEIAEASGMSVWLVQRVARGDTLGMQARSIRRALPRLRKHYRRMLDESEGD